MSTETFPLSAAGKIHHNNSPVELIEASIRRGEAQFASTGALVAVTGEHTGRSVKDKFTVRDELTEGKVWWDNNYSMSREHFENLLTDFQAHAKKLDLYVQDLHVGADPNMLGTRHSSAIFCGARRPISSLATSRKLRSSACRASRLIPSVTAAARPSRATSSARSSRSTSSAT
jgi:hypothetical protein